MSLNWDIRDIKDFEKTCKDEEGVLSAKTHVLILSTMVVGIGSITEKNWTDFYVRLNIIQRESHALLQDGEGNAVYYTPADVKAHIGLWTNVSNETNAAWFKRYMDNHKREAAYTVRKEAA